MVQPGGTAYLCATDGDGLLVSLIQSNFFAFGSGLHVPEWGINLHNRGASFSLDAHSVNVIAPRKRPMHTLIPAMALRDGIPWLVFGSMGGDAQAQIHPQVLSARIVDDGVDLQAAIDAPALAGGARATGSVRRRGPGRPDGHRRAHRPRPRVRMSRSFDTGMGHAHAIELDRRRATRSRSTPCEGASAGR